MFAENFHSAFCPGKFHLLTIGEPADLKTNHPLKKSNTTSDFAMENGEHYENRIPVRLWAEDDLPAKSC